MGQTFSSCQCLKDNGSVNSSIITEHQQKDHLIYDKNHNNNSVQPQRIKTNQEMLQSNGIPRQGAYNTYIRPPTTVGRQSYLVNQMHQQNGVPRQIWEINDDIFETNKSYSNGKPAPIRKTQPIQLYRQNNNKFLQQGNNMNSSLLGIRRTQPIFNNSNNHQNLNSTNPSSNFVNNNTNQVQQNSTYFSNQPISNQNPNGKNLVLQHTMLHKNPINQSVTISKFASSQSPKYGNSQFYSSNLKYGSFQQK